MRSSLVSGETCPGDCANVNASAIAPTNSNHRRDSGAAGEHETGTPAHVFAGLPMQIAGRFDRYHRLRSVTLSQKTL